jgi:hypothetical protein
MTPGPESGQQDANGTGRSNEDPPRSIGRLSPRWSQVYYEARSLRDAEIRAMILRACAAVSKAAVRLTAWLRKRRPAQR